MRDSSSQYKQRDASHRHEVRGLLDAGALAASTGAALSASLGAAASALGLLPFQVFPAALLAGTLGAATGVLVASWRALFLEPPDAAPRARKMVKDPGVATTIRPARRRESRYRSDKRRP